MQNLFWLNFKDISKYLALKNLIILLTLKPWGCINDTKLYLEAFKNKALLILLLILTLVIEGLTVNLREREEEDRKRKTVAFSF